MHFHDYITSRLFRLKTSEELQIHGEGLVFVFPKGGVGTYVAGQANHPLEAGDAIVVHENSGGKLCALGGNDLVYWTFSLSIDQLYPLFASNELCLLQQVAENFRGMRRYPATSDLAQECHRLLAGMPPQFTLEHRCQVLRIAAAILQLELNQAHHQRVGFVRIEDHMIQVFEKLSVSDLLNLGVGELASRFSCSRRHLNRLFHQYFGFSVSALRMEMRLLKAVSLLRDPNTKIINVAEQCGFNHLGLFNTCFKKRFGVSPGQWRKAPPPDNARPASPLDHSPLCQIRDNGLCPWSGKPQNDHPQNGHPQNGKHATCRPSQAQKIALSSAVSPHSRETAGAISPAQPSLRVMFKLKGLPNL